jgi:inner membrane protein
MERSSWWSVRAPDQPPNRRPPRDRGPSVFAWSVALISLVLPWIGLGLCLAGSARVFAGTPDGWSFLAAGAALLVLDILIDFVWAHPAISRSDEPDLNRRGSQLVGRLVVVEEAIVGGRGRVRVGDTVWAAEGPDCARGARVRIAGAQGAILMVEPAQLFGPD